MVRRILALGDTHFPYHSQRALEKVYRLADDLQPTHVVQVGDLYDQFGFSRYPKVLKMEPEKELELARAAAEKMWDHFKGLHCYQLWGNHDDRALKRALSSAPELASLVGKSLRELYTFPGVATKPDSREELALGHIIVQHGHRSKLGDHAKYNQHCTIVGHSHTGGVVFFPKRKNTIWELNCGFLADIAGPAFGYHAQKKFHTTTLGVGWVDELGPRFIPIK